MPKKQEPRSKTVEIKKSSSGPRTIGKYAVIGKISQGGMGAILKAKHPTLNKYIILKQLIIKKSASIIERFRREASLMLDLRSEHIVQVYDHFKENSSYFIAMEYVDGISLEKLIEDKRHLSNDAALLILAEICKGIKYAHDRDVIHRDIKPANILISRDGEVKLGDFGIAKSMDKNAVDLTKAGSALGSPAYIPPEQIFDIQNADKTADIYALGVTLYQMITGKLPFPCNFNPQTVYQIQKGKYILPKRINPRVKTIFQKIILKTVHPNKKKRFKNVDMIMSMIDKYLKNYTQQDVVNETIKNYIRGKEISLGKASPVKSKIKKSKTGILKKIVFTLSALTAASMIMYFSGLYFEFIGNKEYGAIKIEAKTDGDDFFKYNDNIKAVIYEAANDNLREIKTVKLSKSMSSRTTYSSGKIYLRSNQYVVHMNVHDRNYENNIFVNPRIIQKTDPLTKNYGLLGINIGNFGNSPLTFNFEFKDLDTDTPLSNVDIGVLFSGKWLTWQEYTTNHGYDITSGKNYIFMFNKAGYQKREYRIRSNPYDTIINANIGLVSQTGKLLINSNNKNVRILLNGSDHYISYYNGKSLEKLHPSPFVIYLNRILYEVTGRDKGKYAKAPRNIFVDAELTLLPGEYEITASIAGLKAVKKFKVREYKSTLVKINFDETGKSLKLEQ